MYHKTLYSKCSANIKDAGQFQYILSVLPTLKFSVRSSQHYGSLVGISYKSSWKTTYISALIWHYLLEVHIQIKQFEGHVCTLIRLHVSPPSKTKYLRHTDTSRTRKIFVT